MALVVGVGKGLKCFSQGQVDVYAKYEVLHDFDSEDASQTSN